MAHYNNDALNERIALLLWWLLFLLFFVFFFFVLICLQSIQNSSINEVRGEFNYAKIPREW